MSYFVYFFTALILSLTFTPLVCLAAQKFGLVSYPRSDRWHKQPTATLGGAAIYLSALLPTLLFLPLNRGLIGLLSGATVLFLVGLIDDKFRITPYVKLFAQIVAASIAVFAGITLGPPVNSILAVPLTILWIVAVTNAFNLLDNIDGLAAGIAAICSLMLFFSGFIFSNNPFGPYGLLLSAAALGFLPYNFNPARIFMGDSGSMFLGYSLAAVSISGMNRHASNLFITLLVPVFILSVPIFDTILVTVGRLLQGRKVFEGGKDHTSHRLVTLGLSQRKTVLLLYALSASFGLFALFSSRLNLFIISVIAILSLVILLFFAFFLFELPAPAGQSGRQRAIRRQGNKTLLAGIFLYKRRIIEVILDFVLICVAYYSAYFLRFEGNMMDANAALLRESILWIILLKMSVFFAFGLYRGVWRYVSVSDLLTISKAVSIASVVSVLFLTFAFRFREYSRAVFFIDWLLLLFLVCGTRILFRILGEFFSRARERGSNVLIFGAGDTGEMVIREIKRNNSLQLNPVGFIDDDPEKSGNVIQGVSVMGSRKDIAALVRQYQVKEVLIAVPSIALDDFSEIARLCNDCGVPYRRIRGILDADRREGFSRN